MKTIDIAVGLRIPIDYATSKGFVTGKSGSGKTNAGSSSP